MEIATSALILLALLMPGVIFNNAYSRGFWRWNSPTTTQSIAEQIPGSIITAGIFHFVWIHASSFNGHPVHLKSVLMLLLGNYGHEEAYFAQTLARVAENSGWITTYLISLYLMSALLGYSSHWIVRKLKIDRKWRIIRFNNEWFYLLTGEVMEFPDENGMAQPKPKGVFLSAVVEHEDGSYLYQGLVVDFFFDKTGNLDRVVLEFARRRCFKKDSDGTDSSVRDDFDRRGAERYYEIEGKYFMIRYSEMVTINLSYYYPQVETNDSSV